MGSVWRALDTNIDSHVAVKIMLEPQGSDRKLTLERFRREQRILATIRHRAIIKITDNGSVGDIHYFVMEYLEGTSLGSRLRSPHDHINLALSCDSAISLLIGVAEAVSAAHRGGVVHRDLKPDNIFLSREDDGNERIFVLDFGIAKSFLGGNQTKLTANAFLGTPEYMAPEQFWSARERAERQSEEGPAADVFALGAILYECLVGQPLFPPSEGVQRIAQRVSAHHDHPGSLLGAASLAHRLPREVVPILERALAVDPKRRPCDGAALVTELKGICSASGDTLHTLTPFIVDASSRSPPIISQTHNQFATEAAHEVFDGVLHAKRVDEAIGRDDTLALPTQDGESPAESAKFDDAASAPPAEVPGQSRRGVLLLAIAAISALALLLIGLGWLPSAQTAAPPGTTTLVAAQPVAPAPRARSVLVSLRSTPSGAMVTVGGREYGPTPTQVEWSGSEAEVEREVTFRFERRGYREVSVTRQFRGNDMDVEASLLDPTPGGSVNDEDGGQRGARRVVTPAVTAHELLQEIKARASEFSSVDTLEAGAYRLTSCREVPRKGAAKKAWEVLVIRPSTALGYPYTTVYKVRGERENGGVVHYLRKHNGFWLTHIPNSDALIGPSYIVSSGERLWEYESDSANERKQDRWSTYCEYKRQPAGSRLPAGVDRILRAGFYDFDQSL